MTVTTAPAVPVPYVLAYSEEAVPQRLEFAYAAEAGGPRLTYADPRPGDWINGVLRARVRTNRRGTVRWTKLNTRRQWECIGNGLCQVCKQPAADPGGRIPWLLTGKVYQPIGEDGYGTSAPPTCRACIPPSLQHCPQLDPGKVPIVGTASYAEPAGVLGALFRHGPGGVAIPFKDGLFVGWDEFARLTRVLAKLAVVRLHDFRPEPVPAP